MKERYTHHYQEATDRIGIVLQKSKLNQSLNHDPQLAIFQNSIIKINLKNRIIRKRTLVKPTDKYKHGYWDKTIPNKAHARMTWKNIKQTASDALLGVIISKEK